MLNDQNPDPLKESPVRERIKRQEAIEKENRERKAAQAAAGVGKKSPSPNKLLVMNGQWVSYAYYN